MVDPNALTTDELRDLLAFCLSGISQDKPMVSEEYFRKGLADSLADDDAPSIEVDRQMYAAGLLTYGDLSMVDVILDNIPKNVAVGRSTGHCIAAASTVLSAMMPLPSTLRTDGHSVIDESMVRTWLATNRDSLVFDTGSQRFRLRTKG